MKELLLGGMAGLVLGMPLQRMGLQRRRDFRRALGLWRLPLLRSLLLALGVGAMLAALLMWLAVIDVDTISPPPLDGGTVLGGVIFGAALGYSGLAPATAGAVLGSDRFFEGLCAVAGCVAGFLCLPYAERLFPTLRSWLSLEGLTWFRVTLDKPYLFAGGFLGQGCLGLAITMGALFLPRGSAAPPEPPPPAPEPVSTQPDDVQEETIVAALPGEEPVVVDATKPEEPEEHEESG